MKSIPEFFLHLLLAALVTAGPLAASAETEKTTPAKEAKSEKKEDAKETSEEDQFDMSIIPEGQPVKGLKIPFYGDDGTTLQMVVEAEEAKRLDDSHIEMQKLRIDAMSEDEKKFLVEMPSSVFNIESRMLSGQSGVLIKRDDFEIRGKEAEFDLKNRLGKVVGNVQMTIYSTDEFE